jgi:hypothetical protein
MINFANIIKIIITLSIMYTGYDSTKKLYKIDKLDAIATTLVYVLAIMVLFKVL